MKSKRNFLWVMVLGLMFLNVWSTHAQDDASSMTDDEVYEEALPEDGQQQNVIPSEEVVEEGDEASALPMTDESSSSEEYTE